MQGAEKILERIVKYMARQVKVGALPVEVANFKYPLMDHRDWEVVGDDESLLQLFAIAARQLTPPLVPLDDERRRWGFESEKGDIPKSTQSNDEGRGGPRQFKPPRKFPGHFKPGRRLFSQGQVRAQPGLDSGPNDDDEPRWTKNVDDLYD